MSLLAIAVVLIGGVWCGFACDKGWQWVLKLSAFAVAWGGIALVLLAVCDRVTLLDMLLLRYVGDDRCLFGGFETRELFLTYMLLIAAVIVDIRSAMEHEPSNERSSDI